MTDSPCFTISFQPEKILILLAHDESKDTYVE